MVCLPDPFPKLTDGKVLVILFDLIAVNVQEFDSKNCLSAEELARSKIYKSERDRQHFIARRILLRKILASLTGISAEKITYTVNPNGKLSLAEGIPFFSLSKSGGKTAFAFSSTEPVGIDLEQVRTLKDLNGMLTRVCSTAEQNDLHELPDALRLEAFFHIWTQKEAFLKAIGSGLSIEPSQVTVEVNPHNPGKLVRAPGTNPAEWNMITMTPKPGWRLAACVKTREEAKVEFLVG